jgi:flagellar biosynthesis/type III secretory pathway protein FliH
LNDGRNDRQSGHSFRATQDSNYKHADRGYSSGLGDKNQYKQVYRQGYEQGYQQGYNSGGYGRWRY